MVVIEENVHGSTGFVECNTVMAIDKVFFYDLTWACGHLSLVECLSENLSCLRLG